MTEAEVKEALFKEFEAWHHGQTAMIGDNGQSIYYPWDVSKFVSQVHQIVKRHWGGEPPGWLKEPKP